MIVDEAYIEFGGESVVPWLDECPNLIVLRTMSKAFGYAGLRVGYAVAAPATAARARGAAGTGADRVARGTYRGGRAP